MTGIGEGRVVAGRYRLIAHLGRGGMADVWRAEHLALRSDVAVKVIDPLYLTQLDAETRFLREAQAAAALRSPNIVQVFDYGVEDGLPYMVMELLEGESLGARLARTGRLPFPEAARLLSQVARAIGKAHQAGIVHRDLKPDNIFLVQSDDGEIAKVLDFGIAKLTALSAIEATSRTVTGLMLGTPAYMSPEQANESEKVDHRSDLWSLGVIAFECVTGRRPFRGRGLGELLVQICSAPIPVPSSIATVPPEFDAWFARAVARDVDRRFQSAREMADALRDATREPPAAVTGVQDDGRARRDRSPPLPAGESLGNLPTEGTAFVGRRSELRRVRALLANARLVTLVGPGGTGKTRLSLRVGAELAEDFPDGAHFAPLAAIDDARLFASAVAGSLGLPEPGDRPAIDTVVEHLAPRRLLLILDNLEQIPDAATDVARLLDGAPGLRVLVTSRVGLGLPREQVFDVPPLEVPAIDGVADPATLAAVDGVALFVCRAQMVVPGFELSEDNAGAVARIVARLEGLPLAIELAAARVQHFSPRDLARRLERGFELLRGVTGEHPARHQTLRDTVAWSYDLLEDGERTALRRLGVFAGSFSRQAAHDVVAAPPLEDVDELLASLVRKSLLRETGPERDRYSMLEPIREFAEEELEKSGEAQPMRRRHAAYFAGLAEAAEPALRRAGQMAVKRRLEAEEPNLRAALRSCLGVGDADQGLRIGGAIWRFWQSEGRLEEGRRWLSDFLDLPSVSPQARARGLVALAGLAYWQGRYPEALSQYRAAHELYSRLEDAFGVAETLFDMSTASSWSGDAEAGARLAEQALARFEALGAREQVGMVRMAQGFARWMQGDLTGARPLWESSIAIAREVGDHVEAAHKRLALASITYLEGRQTQAMAEAFEAMEELHQHGNVSLTVMALDWIAALAAEREPERCARLAGAAAELRRTQGGGMRPEASGLVPARDVAARLLDATTLDRLWREGARMPLDEAIDYARGLRERLV
jgi:non-specific serine/threonine protein kinase